jgi:hypothetical protein
MKIKSTLIACSLSTAFSSIGFSADQLEYGPGVGIERIYRHSYGYNYNHFSHEGKWSENFGFYSENFGGQGVSDPVTGKAFWSCKQIGPENLVHLPIALMPRTITGDIRQSQIDKELFDTHLVEENYGAAWHMAANNEQGALWKRQAIGHAKKDIEKYIRRAVFEQDNPSNIKALAIVQGFVGTAPHNELNQLFEQTRNAATQRRNALLENPQVAALAAVLQNEYVRQVLGDN